MIFKRASQGLQKVVEGLPKGSSNASQRSFTVALKKGSYSFKEAFLQSQLKAIQKEALLVTAPHDHLHPPRGERKERQGR